MSGNNLKEPVASRRLGKTLTLSALIEAKRYLEQVKIDNPDKCYFVIRGIVFYVDGRCALAMQKTS